MTELNKPVQTQGTTPASSQQDAVTIDAGTLQALVTMLLSERKEQMEERQAKKEAYLAKEKQRRINAKFMMDQKHKSQSLCTHRKGGKSGFNPAYVNYAISHHTYVDASSTIRCLICAMKWMPGDTKEHLNRKDDNGNIVKLPNHTSWGWADAYAALKQTTNTATASEIVLNYRAEVAHAEPGIDPVK
jgi:hypothetical protein